MKIGLTGNIGTGKSTVVSILKELGYSIVDADIIARNVITQEKIINEILYKIDDGILVENNENKKVIDRKKLSKIVFSDKNKLELLNSIIHPEILNEMRKEMNEYNEKYGVVIVDVPLLFEINIQDEFDKIVLVYCSKELQLQRILKRDNRDKQESENIINSQMDINKKVLLSDYVIYNEGTLENLRENVVNVMSEIINCKKFNN